MLIVIVSKALFGGSSRITEEQLCKRKVNSGGKYKMFIIVMLSEMFKILEVYKFEIAACKEINQSHFFLQEKWGPYFICPLSHTFQE